MHKDDKGCKWQAFDISLALLLLSRSWRWHWCFWTVNKDGFGITSPRSYASARGADSSIGQRQTEKLKACTCALRTWRVLYCDWRHQMCVESLHVRKPDFSYCLQLQLLLSEKVTAHISDHNAIVAISHAAELVELSIFPPCWHCLFCSPCILVCVSHGLPNYSNKLT